MSRIAGRFEQLQRQGRAALVTFVTAGDPEPWVTVPLMHKMVETGADVLELGVPFSDPMAEGPVIQKASERALANHIRLRDVLDMVREFRKRDTRTPVVLMGYLNPVEVMGYEAFAAAAAEAGVDGVLTVDLPPEEAQELDQALASRELDVIYLLAPTSTQERIQRVAGSARGFVYYVSLRGVTGASHMDMAEVSDKLTEIRRFTDLPVGVGFGIKNPELAAQIAVIADAVVVGSALVERIARLEKEPERINDELGNFIATLRAAMDQVKKG